MSREPGDVIAFRCGENEYRGIVDVDGRPYTTDPRAQGCRADEFTNIRPLVVVDPEDREQVERLVAAVRDRSSAHPLGLTFTTDVFGAALRSLIEPSKPPEPTGLGAVVEDAEGTLWIKRGQVHWVSPDPHHYNDARTWAEIDYAETHSEGVTS